MSTSTLTIRLNPSLKKRAASLAHKLGIPLTLIIKQALQNFIKKPQVIIGEPEEIAVTPEIQKQMDKIAVLAEQKFFHKNK